MSDAQAIWASIQGRRYTLCTFEHPAALHEVKAWEQSMKDCGRLKGTKTLDMGLEVTVYSVERQEGGDEQLFAIGLPNGGPSDKLRATLAGLSTMLTQTTGMARPWAKALHFGRVPTDDNLNVLMAHWMGVVWRDSPCGHPVCRATHVCCAPNVGSGGA